MEAPSKGSSLQPQEAVNYRPAADGGGACGDCAHFRQPDQCALVQGPIDPTMTCDLYMQQGETMTPQGRMGLEDQLFGAPNG